MFLSNRIYLITLLTKKEVKNKLFSVISPTNKPYTGEIYDNNKYDFKILKNLNYQNSFNPIINGLIYEDQNSSIIKLNISVHPLVKVFTTVWFCGLIIIGFPMVIIGILNQIVPFLISPIAMFIFGIFLVKFGYKKEYILSKKFLIELFNAEQIEGKTTRTSHNKR